MEKIDVNVLLQNLKDSYTVLQQQHYLIENLKKVIDNTNALIDSTSELTIDVSSIKTEINNITHTIEQIQGNITSIMEDIDNAQEDILGLGENVATNTNDIITIKNNISTIQTNVSTLTTDLTTLTNSISTINGRSLKSGGDYTLRVTPIIEHFIEVTGNHINKFYYIYFNAFTQSNRPLNTAERLQTFFTDLYNDSERETIIPCSGYFKESSSSFGNIYGIKLIFVTSLNKVTPTFLALDNTGSKIEHTLGDIQSSPSFTVKDYVSDRISPTVDIV